VPATDILIITAVIFTFGILAGALAWASHASSDMPRRDLTP
jgi:hypothetical protein